MRMQVNLRDALIHLRQRGSKLPLWIDAVCSNQVGEEEKSGQLQLMGDIHRRAACVWVWLGNEVPATAEAIALIPELLATKQTLLERSNVEMTHLEQLGLPPPVSPVRETARAIIDSSWFERLCIPLLGCVAHYMKEQGRRLMSFS